MCERSHLTPWRSVLLSREAHLLKQPGGMQTAQAYSQAQGAAGRGTDGTGPCAPLGGSMRPDSGGPEAAARGASAPAGRQAGTGSPPGHTGPHGSRRRRHGYCWHPGKKENSLLPHLYSIIHLPSKNRQPILKEKENRQFSVRETLVKRSV